MTSPLGPGIAELHAARCLGLWAGRGHVVLVVLKAAAAVEAETPAGFTW
ncbi:hypothetical protein ACWC2K_36070 [Streptomyces chattanoogensis]